MNRALVSIILTFPLALIAAPEPSLEFEGPFDVNNSEYLLPHSQEWQHAKAIEFTITPRALAGSPFSKDHMNYGTGGHLTFFVDPDGKIRNRFQNTASSRTMESAPGLLSVNQDYTVLFTMEPFGTRLYINDELIATNDFVNDISGNSQKVAVGASMATSDPGQANNLGNRFKGVIRNVRTYAEPFVPGSTNDTSTNIVRRTADSVVVISNPGHELKALLSVSTNKFKPKITDAGMMFLSPAPTNTFSILGFTNALAPRTNWAVIASNLTVKTPRVIVIDNRVKFPWVLTNEVYSTNNIVVDGVTNAVTVTNFVTYTNRNYFYRLVSGEG